jgi:hypothetical protein
MGAVSRVESKTQQKYLNVSISCRTCTGQLHNKGIVVLLNISEAETTRMLNEEAVTDVTRTHATNKSDQTKRTH